MGRPNITYELEPNRKAKLAIWQDQADDLQIGEELRRQHKEEEAKTVPEIMAKAKRTMDTLGNIENDHLKFTNLRSRLNTITRADLELKNLPSDMLILDPKYKEYFVKDTYDEELIQLKSQGKADVLAKCFLKMPPFLTVMKNRVFNAEKSENKYGHVLEEFYRPLHNPLSTQRINLHQKPFSKKTGISHMAENSYMGDHTTGASMSLGKGTEMKKLFMTSTTDETRKNNDKPSYFKIKHKLAQLVKPNYPKLMNAADSDFSSSGVQRRTSRPNANETARAKTTRRYLNSTVTPYDRFLKSVS